MSWRPRAAALGYDAFALTDHDGLSGSLAFAHAAREAGVRPITGCEITLDGRRAPDPARRGHGAATRNLCRLHHRRPRRRPPNARGDARAGGPARGRPALPLGLRTPRRWSPGRRRGPARRGRGRWPGGCATSSGATGSRSRCSAPTCAATRAATGCSAELADRLRLRTVATGDVHAHTPPPRAPPGRPGRDPLAHHPRGLRGRAARKPRVGAARALRDRGPVPRRRGPRRRRRWPTAAASTSRSDLGYSYPDFVRHRRARPGRPRAHLPRRARVPLPPAPATWHEARARLEEELGLIAHHGLAGFFLLHRDILEMARDVAVRVRGASAGRRLLPPGRGRGSSVGSIVCYLIGLSHVDPVATRLFLGRFLSRDLASVPDIDLDFPRDVREGLMLDDRRPVRARARRAGGRLPHLPHPGSDPRPRQGARAAAGRGRADGAAGGRVGSGARGSDRPAAATARARRAGARSPS